MLTAIVNRIRNEPAIVNAVLALVALVVTAVVDVIELQGGEVGAIAAAILAAAGITRQRVTPV